MMPRETIILRDKGTRWRLKAAVCVLAWLAYPAATDEDRRRRLKFEQNALAGWFRHRAMADPVWAMRSCKMPPALLFATGENIPKVLERAENVLLSRRLAAGWMLRSLMARYILEEEFAQHPALRSALRLRHIGNIEVCVDVEGRKRPAAVSVLASKIAEIANASTKEWRFGLGGADRSSVLNRIWSPSKPVVHLALALQSYVAEKCENILPRTLTLLEGDWLESVLFNAEITPQYVVKLHHPSMRIAEEHTVRLLFRTKPPTDALVVAKKTANGASRTHPINL